MNNFRSTWDTARSISNELLRAFPSDISYLTDLYKEKIIDEQSRLLILSPQLRDIEGGGFGLTFLFERCTDSNLKLQYFEN